MSLLPDNIPLKKPYWEDNGEDWAKLLGLIPLAASEMVQEYKHVGSSTIPGCIPQDDDWLVLVPDGKEWEFHKALGGVHMFDAPDEGYADGDFLSLKRGKLNLIVVDDAARFDAFALAHYLCVAGMVTDKADRVWIHNALIAAKDCR